MTQIIFIKQHKIILYKVLNSFLNNYIFYFLNINEKDYYEKSSAKEYYKSNRDVILNRSKEYYVNNKESI